MREKVTAHREKTLKLTEQDTCNTSYSGEPEEFKKLVDNKQPQCLTNSQKISRYARNDSFASFRSNTK